MVYQKKKYWDIYLDSSWRNRQMQEEIYYHLSSSDTKDEQHEGRQSSIECTRSLSWRVSCKLYPLVSTH